MTGHSKVITSIINQYSELKDQQSNPRRTSPNFMCNRSGVAVFSRKPAGPMLLILLLITNQKLHTNFWSVLKSTTLNDSEWSICTFCIIHILRSPPWKCEYRGTVNSGTIYCGTAWSPCDSTALLLSFVRCSIALISRQLLANTTNWLSWSNTTKLTTQILTTVIGCRASETEISMTTFGVDTILPLHMSKQIHSTIIIIIIIIIIITIIKLTFI